MSTLLEARAAAPGARRHRHWLLVGLLLVALVVAAGVVDHQRRAHEWKHGGDKVTVHAAVRVTGAAGFAKALADAGGDSRGAVVDVRQGFVVSARWTGRPESGGRYEFVLLDQRVSPARPLRAGSVSDGSDDVTLGWDGRYEALHQHYRWLAATAERRLEDGSYTATTEAAGVPAKEAGSAVLAFYTFDDVPPVTDPAQDLTLAIFFVDSDGEVRWARRVPLTAAG